MGASLLWSVAGSELSADKEFCVVWSFGHFFDFEK